MALDAQGNIFICTCTNKWPVTPGAFQTKFGGGPEDFGIAKFSPAGKLLAATYLGGNGDETNGPDQIAVDATGNVVMAGSSSSTDYPVTPGAFQPKNAGAGGKYPFDGVVSILSNDLSTLVYSTYIGGTGDEMARACFVGPTARCTWAASPRAGTSPQRTPIRASTAATRVRLRPQRRAVSRGWGNGDCWVAKFRAGAGDWRNQPQARKMGIGNGRRLLHMQAPPEHPPSRACGCS